MIYHFEFMIYRFSFQPTAFEFMIYLHPHSAEIRKFFPNEKDHKRKPPQKPPKELCFTRIYVF